MRRIPDGSKAKSSRSTDGRTEANCFSANIIPFEAMFETMLFTRFQRTVMMTIAEPLVAGNAG
jgi:hypothetical protein